MLCAHCITQGRPIGSARGAHGWSGCARLASQQGSASRLRLGHSFISLESTAQGGPVLPSALTLEFSDLAQIERRSDRLQLPRLHDSPERLSLDLREACGLILHAVKGS